MNYIVETLAGPQRKHMLCLHLQYRAPELSPMSRVVTSFQTSAFVSQPHLNVHVQFDKPRLVSTLDA